MRVDRERLDAAGIRRCSPRARGMRDRAGPPPPGVLQCSPRARGMRGSEPTAPRRRPGRALHARAGCGLPTGRPWPRAPSRALHARAGCGKAYAPVARLTACSPRARGMRTARAYRHGAPTVLSTRARDAGSVAILPQNVGGALHARAGCGTDPDRIRAWFNVSPRARGMRGVRLLLTIG